VTTEKKKILKPNFFGQGSKVRNFEVSHALSTKKRFAVNSVMCSDKTKLKSLVHGKKQWHIELDTTLMTELQ